MQPRPWKIGDPVGCGEVFLPTRAIGDAYAAACRDAILTAEARAICSLPDVAARRARIDAYPQKQREALKARVMELWKK